MAGAGWDEQARDATSLAVPGNPQSLSVECQSRTRSPLLKGLIMPTTTNDNITEHRGSRDHGTQTRAARKTAEVIANVRNWARSCDHQIHRR